jgi:hypothetical protein
MEMKMIKIYSYILFFVFLSASPVIAGDFTFTFEWGDYPPCKSGYSNSVPNPKFVLSNVPEGTKFIKFEITDLNVPDWNHGGGTVAYIGDDIIPAGLFDFSSP